MKNTFLFLILMVPVFLSVNKTIGQPTDQKVRVTLYSIFCKNADDHGGSEELYGKVWALNMRTYKTEQQAKQYFDQNEIMKIGDGAGEIWSTRPDNLVVLKSNQSRIINKSIVMTCRPTDQLIILGDLDERDYRNADDRLMSTGSIERKVINLVDIRGPYRVTLVFKSGKTEVWVLVDLTKIS